MQMLVWNQHSRKMGWNDRISAYLTNIRKEPGCEHHTALTAFDLIEQTEDREPPAMRS